MESETINGQEHSNMDPSRERGLLIGKKLANAPPGEEVVITGMASLFPECEDMEAFKNNLFNKVDMVTAENKRWDMVDPDLPERSGKVPNITKFDPGFFGIHKKAAAIMEPMCRTVLERIVESIYDAGFHPEELEGTRTGIFLSANNTDYQRILFKEDLGHQNFVMTGILRSMIPHHAAYHLKFKAPAYVLDTACSSTMFGLEHAYKAIRQGEIDAAIVAGTSISLHPRTTLQFSKLGILSMDGSCKVFDDSANGYARAEAVSAIFIQKAKDSRRIYAKVTHVFTNCDGYKDKGITNPSSELQKAMLEEFYQQSGIDPATVDFIEAHGTGTVVGDVAEVIPIDEVFCKHREGSLLIGSVKSNMGHSEHVAALAQIAKAIIAMNTELIPPNIHFNKPRQGVEALESGRLKVVTEATPFKPKKGLISISSFGFGGANGHCVLKWNEKKKIQNGLPNDELPRLVCINGRTSQALDFLINDLKNRPLDVEFVALLHKIFRFDRSTHRYRGYAIILKQGEFYSSQKQYDHKKSQFGLVFGDVSQILTNTSKQLLEIPVFLKTIQRIEKYLSTKGISIINTINNKEGSISDLNQTIAAVAVQIALFELFKTLQIQPSYTLGYSYGEFANAYANGTYTMEQAILAAYNIGKLVLEIEKSSKSKITRSNGHVEDNLIQEEVKSNGHIESIIKNLKNNKINELASDVLDITEPPSLKKMGYASPEYLLEQILYPGIGSSNLKNIPSTENTEQAERNVTTLSAEVLPLLQAIGSLYEAGWNPDLEKLYPPVEFPVSRGTPMISPIVKWRHDEDWHVVSYNNRELTKISERVVAIDTKEGEWGYVSGHVIDGRNLFPATGYLYIVWETLARIHDVAMTDIKVAFENVKFIRATTIPKDVKIEFVVSIHRGSGNFEVSEKGVTVVTGNITKTTNVLDEQFEGNSVQVTSENGLILLEKDIYKELRLRGYNYSGLFRGVKKFYSSVQIGFVEWKENWVAFMDNILQLQILNVDSRNLYVPTHIQRITIDPVQHELICKDAETVAVYFSSSGGFLRSGGIEIRGLNASSITRRKQLGEPVLEKYVFIPNEATLSTEQSVRVNVQIALENNYRLKVKVVELIDEESKDQEILGPIFFNVLGDQPLIHPEVVVLSPKPIEAQNVTVSNKQLSTESEALLVVINNGLTRDSILNDAFKVLLKNGYVVSRESLSFDLSVNQIPDGVEVLTVHTTSSEKLVLLTQSKESRSFNVIDVSDCDNFGWIAPLQEAIKNDSEDEILLLAHDDPNNGILGLLNCIRREPGGEKARCVFLQSEAVKFDPDDEFYRNQLKKGLAINVYKNGKWGGYRHLLLEQFAEIDCKHCYAGVTTRGDLSSFKWIEGPIKSEKDIDCDKDIVYTYFSSINFKDVMTATGRLQTQASANYTEHDSVQGIEYSGRDSSGRRVAGFVPSGALATMISANKSGIVAVPDDWSLSDAATVPVVYGTVLYALLVKAGIKRGQSILIHAGSGGIGQAAINVTNHYGLEIYTTVGTEEKRDFIKKHFPMIKESRIGNSRDTSFEQLILKETKGRGVDLILNSLAEEKLQASLRCLAKGGKFVEIGKFDLTNQNPLHLELFKRGVSFHGVHLDRLLSTVSIVTNICNMLRDGIRNGSVKALPKTCFGDNELETAFRFIATGKHIGKVLINIREEEEKILVKPQVKLLSAIPKYYCDPEYSYIITGGLGGFGLELADWLVQRGARKLLLSSRNGLRTGYQALRINTWRSKGTKVEISTAPIVTEEGCRNLLQHANTLGPVAAIFHLAVVLHDAILENQTQENFVNSFGPKATAMKLFDKLTRKLCPDLRNFVVFSSVSCGKGNAGQTNYGMANSVMERICETRKEEGLPALAIEWGAVGDVGLVAEMQSEDKILEIGGTLQQRISSCLEVMDLFMKRTEPILSSIVVAEKRSASGSADNVVDCVANILGVRDTKTISLHSTLSELGMDSMMAAEIKQTLEREFEIFLTPEEVRSLTFARLHEIMSEKEGAKLEAANNAANLESDSSRIQAGSETENIFEIPLVKCSTEQNKQAQKTVILFPGIEGIMAILQPIADSLKSCADVWCAQYCGKCGDHSVVGVTLELLEEIKQVVSKEEPFYFIAHSYGCIIALELAALLEKEGLTGTLVLIDGSPKTLKNLSIQRIGHLTGIDFEIKVLEHVVPYLVPEEAVPLVMSDLQRCANLEERISTVAERITSTTKHTIEYIKKGVHGLYMRSIAVLNYDPSYNKLKSPVKLYRPTEEFMITGAERDYGLSELVEGPIEVEFFEGGHTTVLKNSNLIDAIHKLFI